MPCPHCGTKVNVRAKVCAACGRRVKKVGIPGKLIALGLAGFMLAIAMIVMVRGPARRRANGFAQFSAWDKRGEGSTRA